MESKVINLYEQRVGQSIISINAKVANAIDMVQNAKEMAANSADALIRAQQELEELYIALIKR